MDGGTAAPQRDDTGGEPGNLADLAGAVLDETPRAAGRTSSGRRRPTTRPENPAADADTAVPGVGGGPDPADRKPPAEPLTLRQGLRRGGTSVFTVLLILTALDELEGAALAVLAPDIRDSLGVGNGTIVFLGVAAGAFTVLGAVPMGWIADRFRRGPVIGVSTAFFAAMVFLSGFAMNAFMFFWTRFGAGVAKSNSGPVQGSLLADTYPIGIRGRLGASIGVGGRLCAVLSPLVVGGIAAAVGGPDGWRWAYYLLGLPVLIFAAFAFFLPEPPRGQWEKADVLGEVIEDENPPPISIEAAFARLGRIRTLKTVILAFAAMGFGLFTTPVLGNLFLEQEYGLGAFERGLVGTAGGIGGLLVLPFIGRYYDRRFREDPAQALRLIGLLIVPSALFAPLQYFSPNPVLYTVFGVPQIVLLSCAFALMGPLMQTIVPYRLRGLGTAMASIYVFFIGATGGGLVSAPLIDSFGPRTAVLITLVPATVIGGLLIMRGAGYVHDDLALIVAELHEEHEEHERRRARPDQVPVLQLNHVDFSYGQVQVLFDVGLEVRRGEVLALLGTNGAGKSTILRLIAGLATPERGVIRLGGRTVTFVAPEQRIRLGIVSLAGGAGVFPGMSVRENLEMGAYIHRADPEQVRARIERSLALFPQLVERAGEPASALSGGQQQMLALAMALLHDPEVLLIDELSLGLAPAMVAELLAVIERLRAEGLAMIVVEQSLNVAMSIADRAIFLEKGRIRFEGAAADLAERDFVRAVFLGGDAEAGAADGTAGSFDAERSAGAAGSAGSVGPAGPIGSVGSVGSVGKGADHG
ncbi:MFS transporter (plasmid) [Embleya sp. NBC_00888]|uniref:ATP-binding protein n=1 Tax=Embleya sp. NBC_00888 TaxID=2975960 RepID=UPI002F90CF1F|nr:MFS transporter [Embleya sp. NBC_00888]